MGSTAERRINTSCLLQKVLLLLWVTSCQSTVTEKQLLVDRTNRASHHFTQSITSLAFLLPGFGGFVLTQIITFYPQNLVLLRFWRRRIRVEFDQNPYWIQDNCPPGTGKTVKTDQVRRTTVFHWWCMRGRADSKLRTFVWLGSSKHVSFTARRVFQLCRCDHSTHTHTHRGPGPTSMCTHATKAATASTPAWPESLHLCCLASFWYLHPPSPTSPPAPLGSPPTSRLGLSSREPPPLSLAEYFSPWEMFLF